MTHFGESDDVEAQLAELAQRLDDWVALAREGDRDAFVASIEAEIERGAEAGVVPAYRQAADPDQMYAGLDRYIRKRAAGAQSARVS